MSFRGRGAGLLSGEAPDEEAELEPRKCLVVDPTQDEKTCKHLGGEDCQWNMDAIVDCHYMRGDDVDVSEWEGSPAAPVPGITDKMLDEEP